MVFASAPPVAGTLIGVFVTTFGGVITQTAGAAALYEHHGSIGQAAVSEAHSLAAAIGIAASALLSICLQTGIGWQVPLLMAVPCVATLLILLGRTPVPNGMTPGVPSPARWPSARRFRLAMTAYVSCLMIEFSLVFWVVRLLAARTSIDEGIAAFGLTSVMIGIATGRFVGARFAARHDADTLLLFALTISGTASIAFWAGNTPLLSFGARLACGLGIALHSPLSMIRVINSYHGRPERASGHASTAGGVALAIGPFTLGALLDTVGTTNAFLLIPALHATAGCAILATRTRQSALTPPQSSQAL